MITIRASNASLICTDILRHLTNDTSSARWEEVSPRDMPIRELRNVRMVLTDPTRCAAWMPKRQLNYPFMFGEFFWMWCGENSVDMISYYCKEIARFSDDGKIFFGAYGPRWVDALPSIIDLLEHDVHSRQAVVQIWRPEVYEMGFSTKDVPCTLAMQYLIRRGLLEASIIMRSSDSWLGLPYDLFNFAMLQRCVARSLNRQPGPMTLFVVSSHLYERDLERAREVEAASDSLEHATYVETLVRVPDPPTFDDSAMPNFEARLRTGTATNEEAEMMRQSPHWPFLSMLNYRRHGESALVHESVRGLLT
jgi:thymidylate synthase